MEKFVKRTEDGSMMSFDYDHYWKVVHARRMVGKFKADSGLHNVEIKDHPLIGTKLVYEDKIYLVEKVNKQWYNGYYLGFLLQRNGSHLFTPFENINCENECIIKQIDQARIKYSLETN